MIDNPEEGPQPGPLTIPGEDLPLLENDLILNVGKYLSLYEWAERKRLILVQAYTQVVAERDALKKALDSKE